MSFTRSWLHVEVVNIELGPRESLLFTIIHILSVEVLPYLESWEDWSSSCDGFDIPVIKFVLIISIGTPLQSARLTSSIYTI